ncbi:hypothetical protein [Maribacter sp. 2307ULW6-5]|uniref:hypothetical protein n=1 Tax=Maribacter sp. 2307ULW6-5 TaxID=3386275 RepID=UPI0039BC8B13
MSTAQPFYPHDPDSEIMLQKDRAEAAQWIKDLEHAEKELALLRPLSAGLSQSGELTAELDRLREKNNFALLHLRLYAKDMANALECDTMACDAYHLENHEQHRQRYAKHIEAYRTLKLTIMEQVAATDPPRP